MAFIQCKNFVKNRLRAPSTADFPFLDRSAWALDQNVYVIKSYVDAQNGFGAITRTNWHCKIQYNGGNSADQNNWTLLDLETY